MPATPLRSSSYAGFVTKSCEASWRSRKAGIQSGKNNTWSPVALDPRLRGGDLLREFSMTAASSQISALIGHEAAKKQIEAAYRSGRMHHAWLITGPEGIGKASLATLAAHLVLSGGENGFERFNPGHSAAKLIMAESHPDLFILRREADEKTGVMKDTISVEQARALTSFLRMTSAHGHGRVAIIDEAHNLTRNAQNAVLKMIEEPPSGAVIFLTATTAGTLLPTIRSRCRLLALEPLAPQEVETVLARLGADLPEGEEKARLLGAAGGSAGLALRIAETGVLPLFDEALAILSGGAALDVARLHKLADLVGLKTDAESFKLLSALLIEAFRANVRAAPAGQLDRALQVWEKAKETFAMAETGNLDKKLAFIVAMTDAARSMKGV